MPVLAEKEPLSAFYNGKHPDAWRRGGSGCSSCRPCGSADRSSLARLPRVPPPSPNSACHRAAWVKPSRIGCHPDRRSFSTALGFRLTNHAREAHIGSARQVGPTQCCCAGPTCFVSPLSSPSLPRFLVLPRLPSAQGSAVPKLDSPYLIQAPSRSRSNRRIRSPSIPWMLVSARRDSKARDLPGSIVHRASD